MTVYDQKITHPIEQKYFANKIHINDFITHPLQKPRSESKRLLAVFWCLLGLGFFAVTMSIMKILSHDFSTISLVFIRLLFALAFLFPILLKNGSSFLKTKKLPLHGIRGALVASAMLCTYYTYANLPLAIATSIGFTGPLITILISIIFFKERINIWTAIAIALGYFGILIIVQPTNFIIQPAIIVALLGNLLASSAVFTAKELSKTESATQIVFYTGFVNFLLISLIFAYQYQIPTLEQVPLLIVLGFVGLASQFCLVKALSYVSPAFLAPFEYARLIFMIPLGILLFNEIPNVYTLLGSTLIIGSILFLSFHRKVNL